MSMLGLSYCSCSFDENVLHLLIMHFKCRVLDTALAEFYVQHLLAMHFRCMRSNWQMHVLVLGGCLSVCSLHR